MKKILTLLLLSAIFLSSAIFSVKAASYDFANDSGVATLGRSAGYIIGTGSGAVSTPEYYVGLVLSVFFTLLGLIFMILTIYAGIKWMTAQGNTSQIEQAKDTLTRAIVGLVICMVAYGLTFFVINIFQGNNQGAPNATTTIPPK